MESKPRVSLFGDARVRATAKGKSKFTKAARRLGSLNGLNKRCWKLGIRSRPTTNWRQERKRRTKSNKAKPRTSAPVINKHFSINSAGQLRRSRSRVKKKIRK